LIYIVSSKYAFGMVDIFKHGAVVLFAVLTFTRMFTTIDIARSVMVISSPSVVIIFIFIVLVESTFEPCRVITYDVLCVVINNCGL